MEGLDQIILAKYLITVTTAGASRVPALIMDFLLNLTELWAGSTMGVGFLRGMGGVCYLLQRCKRMRRNSLAL